MSNITELAAQLGRLLLAQGEQVATAESCTGGGIAEAITRITGSSAWFEAGYITYSNQQKIQMLQVSQELFSIHGAVSLAVVEAMARGAQKHSGARYVVAVSGIAGPGGGSAEKPVGTVCFAWLYGCQILTAQHVFTGDRAAVRRETICKALSVLSLIVQGEMDGS